MTALHAPSFPSDSFVKASVLIKPPSGHEFLLRIGTLTKATVSKREVCRP
jgi:hypothetical protein